MPILGGAQVLFLANSLHQQPSPYPVYSRSFLKEVMRVSMARNYEAGDVWSVGVSHAGLQQPTVRLGGWRRSPAGPSASVEGAALQAVALGKP